MALKRAKRHQHGVNFLSKNHKNRPTVGQNSQRFIKVLMSYVSFFSIQDHVTLRGIGVARIFDWGGGGGANHKSNAMMS